MKEPHGHQRCTGRGAGGRGGSSSQLFSCNDNKLVHRLSRLVFSVSRSSWRRMITLLTVVSTLKTTVTLTLCSPSNLYLFFVFFLSFSASFFFFVVPVTLDMAQQMERASEHRCYEPCTYTFNGLIPLSISDLPCFQASLTLSLRGAPLPRRYKSTFSFPFFVADLFFESSSLNAVSRAFSLSPHRLRFSVLSVFPPSFLTFLSFRPLQLHHLCVSGINRNNKFLTSSRGRRCRGTTDFGCVSFFKYK
jgi:hypothetical protein